MTERPAIQGESSRPRRCVLTVGLALWLSLTGCDGEPVPPQAPGFDPSEPAREAPEAAISESAAEILDPASPLDSFLRGGETHGFEIALAKNQLLDLRVDQQGVDVVVKLLGPLGESLLEVDNPSGADGSHGPERVFWIAEQAGRHGLEIHAPRASGRYLLTVDDLRPAAPGDRARVDAEKAKAEADVLYGQATPRSRRSAIDRYREALAGFAALGDDLRQADTQFRLGEAWRKLGEKQRASTAWEAALPLYEAHGNRRQEALTLHELCRLYYYERYRVDLALERCQRALPLWEATGDLRGLALTSNQLGLVYRLLREDHRALISYDRAIELWRDLARPDEEAKTLNNRGRLYAGLGDYRQAVVDLEQALAVRRALGRGQEIADTLNSLGFVHAQWKAREAARRSFQEALEIWPEQDDLTTGNSLFGLGVTMDGAEIERASDAVEQSLEIYRAVPAPQGEAMALLGLSRIHSSRNRHVAARETLTEALEVFESIRDFSGLAETRLAMAVAERELGSLDTARQEIERALAIVEDLRASVAAGGDLRASFFATKQVYYELYVDLLMELHFKRPGAGYQAAALAASERARSRSLIEALTDRRSRLRQQVDPRLLADEASLKRQIYANEARILHLSFPGAEPGMARRLEREQQDLLRRYEKLQGRIRLSSPRYADLTRSRLLGAEEIQRQLLDSETLLLEYQLGGSRSFLWAVTPEAITAFVLPARDELAELAELTYRRIADNKRVSRARIRKHLAELSHLLLGPVKAQLEPARRLLIVADGALHYLPFEALPLPGDDPSDPVLAEQVVATAIDVVYLPSASTLAVLRGRIADREPAPRLLAVLADPVFDPQDPRLLTPGAEGQGGTGAAASRGGGGPAEPGPHQRLIHSGLEAETILTLAPAESRFEGRGFAASRDALVSGDLGRYRILHFATHGDLSSEHAGLSRLVLSRYDATGQPREDGFWYAYEIYGDDLPVELVVLSACQTALGEPIRGEGLVGLTQGFMNAGAARVVVSLWRVDDRATAALMGRFYQNMLKHRLSPPAALRAAKQFIRNQEKWQDPYFWAGFVLRGEWRDIPR